MAIVTDQNAVAAALDIIKESAVLAKNKENKEKPETIVHRHSKRYDVKQSDYLKFMKQHGITPDTLTRVTDLNRCWNTGASKFAMEAMEESAKEAIKDKEYIDAGGMKNLQVGVKTTVKDGVSLVAIKAFSENVSMLSENNDIVQKFGQTVLRHKVSISKAIDSEQVAAVSSSVESLIRGKF